jgi:hypothetical protein
MRRNLGLLLFLAVVLMVGGCGGSSSDQSSALTFEMALLEIEGEHLIQGTVYNDFDGDGIMDMGEPGIEGATVTLLGLDSTATDAMGHYVFSSIAAGAYTVVETDPVGFISTTPNQVSVTVVEEDVTVNFGDQSDVPIWSIYGIVYDDLNGDGVMDTGEPGIPDVIVTLIGIGDVMTGIDGSYAFAVAATGAYTVVETDPDGYISTTPNEVTREVVDVAVIIDFGDRFIEELPVDVKPGSDINPLNLKSNGVLPVAILGSETFDVAQIDPASLLLNGVPPLRWSYEDVCGYDDMPVHTDMNGDDEEMPDGYEDMTLKFSTPEIAAWIIAEFGDVARGDIVTLTMTGLLMDGSSISGEEMVWIVQVPKDK